MGDVPSDVGYLTVVAQAIEALADSIDVDYFPDAIPFEATVTLTPVNLPRARPYVVAFADQKIISLRSIQCQMTGGQLYAPRDGSAVLAHGGSDAVINAGDTLLTISSAAFTSADVGRAIHISGAGTLDTDLVSTIASITNPRSVHLVDAAVQSVSEAFWNVAEVDPVPSVSLVAPNQSSIDLQNWYWEALFTPPPSAQWRSFTINFTGAPGDTVSLAQAAYSMAYLGGLSLIQQPAVWFTSDSTSIPSGAVAGEYVLDTTTGELYLIQENS